MALDDSANLVGRGDEGRRPFRFGRLLGRLIVLAVFLVGFWLWFVWPPPVWYRWNWPRSTSFMSMRQSEQAQAGAQPAAPILFRPVPLEKIASPMRSAVLVAEDNRFYEHHGLDYVELRHALGYQRDSFSFRSPKDRADLWAALRRSLSGRQRIRGASTITQQLAKNLYLSSSRNPLRKVKEAVLAWRLEYWLGKERILELYLNVAELGPGIWGVEAASQKYFRHPASRLSSTEAAALAGSLPFPLRSNPDFRPGRMRWRQALILRRMRGEMVVVPRVDLDSMQILPAPKDTFRLPDSIPIPVIDTIGR
ncbi:MAG: transglycosylase domain-containing protein [Gemmatimonadales bacterium]